MMSSNFETLSNIFSKNALHLLKEISSQIQVNNDESKTNKQFNNSIIINTINKCNKRKFHLIEYHDYEIVFEYNNFNSEIIGKRTIKLNQPLISNKNLKMINKETKFANSQKIIFKISIKDIPNNRIYQLYKGLPDNVRSGDDDILTINSIGCSIYISVDHIAVSFLRLTLGLLIDDISGFKSFKEDWRKIVYFIGKFISLPNSI